MNPLYPAVARRAGHRCEYRRAPEVAFNSRSEVEHIHPTSRGGRDEPANLALSCRSCNAFKSDQVEGFDERTGEITALFNPREELWADHFQYDPDTGEVFGLTQTGRATVQLLGMNEAPQLLARTVWVQARIYP